MAWSADRAACAGRFCKQSLAGGDAFCGRSVAAGLPWTEGRSDSPDWNFGFPRRRNLGLCGLGLGSLKFWHGTQAPTTHIPTTNAMAEGFTSKVQSFNANARGFRSAFGHRTGIIFRCGRLDLFPAAQEIARGIQNFPECPSSWFKSKLLTSSPNHPSLCGVSSAGITVMSDPEIDSPTDCRMRSMRSRTWPMLNCGSNSRKSST